MRFMESNQSIQIGFTEASTSSYFTDAQLTIRIKISSCYFSFFFPFRSLPFLPVQCTHWYPKYRNCEAISSWKFCRKKFSLIMTTHESFRFFRNLYLWTQKKYLSQEIILKGTVKIHFSKEIAYEDDKL